MSKYGKSAKKGVGVKKVRAVSMQEDRPNVERGTVLDRRVYDEGTVRLRDVVALALRGVTVSGLFLRRVGGRTGTKPQRDRTLPTRKTTEVSDE